MGDKAEKLTLFRSMLGGGVDEEVARQLLEAHGWDVQAACNTMFDGGGIPPQNLPQSEPDRRERAPMRTGYTDNLMAPQTFADRQREEAERQERERENARLAEERRIVQEKAHRQDLERNALEQRREAERMALERRRQQQQEADEQRRRKREQEAQEQASRRKQEQETEQQAPRGLAIGGAISSALSSVTTPAPSPQPQAPAPTPATAASPAPVATAAAVAPAAVAAETPAAAPPVASTSSQKTEADPVAPALMALRRRYKESDPAGLSKCLSTLKVYIQNLANAPHEPKFQRINCENAVFQQRVGAYEGSIAVLEACGFVQDGNALVVGADFQKSKGTKLMGTITKINIILDQLK